MKQHLYWLIILLGIGLMHSVCVAAETIGTFSDVQFIKQEDDCVGLEVKLWKKGQEIAGHLRDYEGPCEAKTLPLSQVKYNSTTGSISFRALRSDGFVHVFNGVLTADALKGEELVAKEPIPSDVVKSFVVLKRKKE